jgi:quercetin dioxygenase-like cupin family protein
MKTRSITTELFCSLVAFAAIGIHEAASAHHAGDEVKVKQLSQRDIIEKLDGNETSATILEVTFESGQRDTPHRHAGPVFGYVLEGEYEHAIDNGPVTIYKKGDTFYEPSGCLHRVAANASRKNRTRLLAVILYPRGDLNVTYADDHK